jgi:hypothetical protein
MPFLCPPFVPPFVPLPPRPRLCANRTSRRRTLPPHFAPTSVGSRVGGMTPLFACLHAKGRGKVCPPLKPPPPTHTRAGHASRTHRTTPLPPPLCPTPVYARTGVAQQPHRENDPPPPFCPCVQRGPGEVCSCPFLVPTPVFPCGCMAPRACPRPPSLPHVQRGRAPPLCMHGEVRGLSPPPPFCAVRATLPLRGMRKEGGAQARNTGWNAKGTPPSPPFALALPLMCGPPVRALAPSPSPLSVCTIRAPCLYRAYERGGAGKVRPLFPRPPLLPHGVHALSPRFTTCAKREHPTLHVRQSGGGGSPFPCSVRTLPLWGM